MRPCGSAGSTYNCTGLKGRKDNMRFHPNLHIMKDDAGKRQTGRTALMTHLHQLTVCVCIPICTWITHCDVPER